RFAARRETEEVGDGVGLGELLLIEKAEEVHALVGDGVREFSQRGFLGTGAGDGHVHVRQLGNRADENIDAFDVEQYAAEKNERSIGGQTELGSQGSAMRTSRLRDGAEERLVHRIRRIDEL